MGIKPTNYATQKDTNESITENKTKKLKQNQKLQSGQFPETLSV